MYIYPGMLPSPKFSSSNRKALLNTITVYHGDRKALNVANDVHAR